MKNNKLLAIFLSVLLVSLSGCGKEKPQGKYIVWVGGEFAAVGYHTDSYTENNGMIEFTTKRKGNKKIVPVCSITDIDVNKKAN